MTQSNDQRKKVFDILNGFSTAMFVTTASNGQPHARPMHVARVDDGSGAVWFFTGKGGTLVDELKSKNAALLVFQDEKSAYLSLRGQAKISGDKAKIKELWQEPYKVWFPQGPEDPEIALVEVDPTDAEYWDNRGTNRLQYLFEAAKAYVKGEKPDVKEGEQHAKATL